MNEPFKIELGNATPTFVPAISTMPIQSLPQKVTVSSAAQQLLKADSTEILAFGTATLAQMDSGAKELLQVTRAKELDGLGDGIRALLPLMKSVNLADPTSDHKSKIPFIGGLIDKATNTAQLVVAKYDTVSNNIDKVVGELHHIKDSLVKLAPTIENMYQKAGRDYDQLGKDITVLTEAIAAREFEAQTQLQAAGNDLKLIQDANRLRDSAIIMAQQKSNLEGVRTVTLQRGPKLQALRMNVDLQLMKFQQTIGITLPIWRDQLSDFIIANKLTKNADAFDAADDFTQKLLIGSAKATREATVKTAKSALRLIIDPQTAQQTHNEMIGMLEDLNKVAEDGKKLRSESDQLNLQLQQNLLTAIRQH